MIEELRDAPLDIIAEVANVPVIRKPSDYDSYNNTAEHLRRRNWYKAFRFAYPEDIYLGISKGIDPNKIPSQFFEIYSRFWELGFIDNHGDQCVLMACTLRRILRLHGFKANARQMICYWEKESKGQKVCIGSYNNMNTQEPGTIDTHMAVEVDGYILDFALSPINQLYGATAPRALIGIDSKTDNYQDFGISGQAVWVDVKPQHPIIKHWRLKHKALEMDLVNRYFEVYQF